ncbi:MAG: hypothetical protein AAFY41_14715, partial [Bacteroidota bacterium]
MLGNQKIFLLLGAVALVIGIYQLPRVVVENDQLQEVSTTTVHSLEIPSDVNRRMIELRTLIEIENNHEKKANFAHSLAKYYLDYNLLDSAVAIAD